MEAYHYIMDTAGPGHISPQGGAQHLLHFINALEEKQVRIEDLVTVQGGMEALIDALLDDMMHENEAR